MPSHGPYTEGWPKWRCMNPDHHPEGHNSEGQICHDCPDLLTEVIPADLGRELADALYQVVGQFHYADDFVKRFGKKPHRALARYEREVGEPPVQTVSEFMGSLRDTIEAATEGKVSITDDSRVIPGPNAESSE